ncbi:MAG: type III-A CRISPR-associated RAMP protein Csm3 [Bacteroidales bacterium]|nr:type III-A CRISPR-associated RAMP protein Csm3 [Bacteroidales bacterium]
MENNKLKKKLIIKTVMTVETGMHIGGSSDNVEIGGIDNPVIKIGTQNGKPLVPGSSLKGKIRSLLEQMAGVSEAGGGTKKNGQSWEYKDKPEKLQKIINLFGYSGDKKISKIIVRDSEMLPESLKLLEDSSDFLDMPYTENKYENTIDRVTGVTTGGGIRQTERVPAGVKFNVEFVINVWDEDGDGENLKNLLKEGIKALELDYLGGSGSRGYGKVSFDWKGIENPKEKDMQNLINNEA